ncbi:prolyl oligopeptidase family serine peptidase [Actinospica sp.]|uniref:prolyl oligopeptidase family serine peptidase n=1 Tax=Actinospica sp. TaxID=1872142 RepID=UPI002C178EEC|nr:prolyl oligopeptidase family serine peptidase [Actinospica sp.]HWG22554.1 prolyl oligopeptidase family serine peptidase [Actinospica sp.]
MSTTDSAFPPSAYPLAERLDLVEELHGQRIADPYRRLEDPAAARTVAWSAAQDELFAAFQDAAPDGGVRREAFRARVGELADAGEVTAPVWRGERRFFTRRAPGQEHSVLLTAGQDGVERVLIDPTAIDPTGATTLDLWFPSRDGALLAYLVSAGGTEEALLRVIDVQTGDLVDGPIDRARYSQVAWLPDGMAYYYTRRLAPELVPEDERQYYRRVYLHRLNTDPAEDVLVFGDGLDKTNFYGLTVSRDGRWLAVSTYRGTSVSNDLHLADLTESGPEKPRWIAVQEGVEAQVQIHFGHDGKFYLSTDRDAPNLRLCVADPDALAYERWRDVLPENPTAVLEDFVILQGEGLAKPAVLGLYAWHGVSRLHLFDLGSGELIADVATPGAGTISALYGNQDGGARAWFGYVDHVTPVKVLAFDARTREVTTWADTPGAVQLATVHVRHVLYPSKDGTMIPLTILAPAGEPDRPRPTILYGYGGFSLTLSPDFAALRLAWVEAGGVFAIANLRGGTEEGETWHRAGRLDKKQNVFDDFHAAGDHLTAEGWTTREQLGIFGGSNGGLLVGTALTQRPDAYSAVVCSAPLLDMLRYELFGLGALWNVEYGSAEVPEEFGWLRAYSPYHNVHEGTAYPATLFTIFEGDTRVDTLHARKLAAALQHATSAAIDERPILVRREHNVGHSTRSVTRSLTLWADQLSFFARQLGLDGTPER